MPKAELARAKIAMMKSVETPASLFDFVFIVVGFIGSSVSAALTISFVCPLLNCLSPITSQSCDSFLQLFRHSVSDLKAWLAGCSSCMFFHREPARPCRPKNRRCQCVGPGV